MYPKQDTVNETMLERIEHLIRTKLWEGEPGKLTECVLAF